ncbi:arginine--tRNA ligase [Candidatus Bathyarchaeota archaeon]|nr:arginine--tRNA ligase [Candidatus Bathyarchaeota archaeon]
MSNPLNKLREECSILLKETITESYPGVAEFEIKFTTPPNVTMGELSSPLCFQLSKQIKKNPFQVAIELVRKIKHSSLISSVEAVNGYINFHVNIEEWSKLVLETVINDSTYGYLKTGDPEKVIVEHTSANPIHPITIGTARNAILGDCLAKLVKKRGHDLSIHFLVNDMGRQVALAVFGWKLLGTPEPNMRGELFVGGIYASTNVCIELKKVNLELKKAEEKEDVSLITELQEELEKYEDAAIDLEKNYPLIFNSIKEKISLVEDPSSEIVQINTAYETNQPDVVKLFRKLVKICLDGFQESLGDLGIVYDAFDYESDLVWAKKADEVLDNLRKTDFVEEDQGALVLDCDGVANIYGLKQRWGLSINHEIPRLVLVRKDGTTLYPLRDMAYSIYKFSLADKVINVIGQEQALAQLQVRIALAAIGKMDMGDNQLHYGYEFVKLPEGKMSGRLGRYVTLQEVVDKSVELAFDEVTKRTPDLPEEQRKSIARMVGYGAVKYTLLSVDANKTVIFDWDKALNFETNSAPFIQYSHARTCNIIKRAESKPNSDYGLLTDPKEREIISLLASFPEVFQSAADQLKPVEITSYANTLADKFNSFYSALRVLNAEKPELIGARLTLVEAARIVLANSLNLLGIEAPERM